MKEEIKSLFTNELTEIEVKKLLEKIKNSPELLQLYSELKAAHTVQLIKKCEDTKSVQKEFNNLNYKLFKLKLRKYIAVAALLVGFIYTVKVINGKFYNQKDTELASGNLMIKQVVLPDGSTVVLKENSTIRFSDFSKSRNVTLTGGAFFDVKKDSTKPFTVQINKVNIRVLGTTFNVEGYKNQDFIKTILFTGKVSLKTDKGVNKTLSPNQIAVYNKTTEDVKIEDIEGKIDVNYYKNNWLVFKNAHFITVKKELERRYKKTIKLQFSHQDKYRFTGKFDTKTTLKEVLEIIEMTTPIDYEIKQDVVIIKNKINE